jgi:hypothetical protein
MTTKYLYIIYMSLKKLAYNCGNNSQCRDHFDAVKKSFAYIPEEFEKVRSQECLLSQPDNSLTWGECGIHKPLKLIQRPVYITKQKIHHYPPFLFPMVCIFIMLFCVLIKRLTN